MDIFKLTPETLQELCGKNGFHLYRRPNEYIIVTDDYFVGPTWVNKFEDNPSGYYDAVAWMKTLKHPLKEK